MDDSELRQLAVDILDGRVFGTWSLDDFGEAARCFLVLSLLDEESRQNMVDDEIVHVYEYLDKDGPMAVNGNPQFFSANLLDRETAERLFPLVKELYEQRSEFLEGSPS